MAELHVLISCTVAGERSDELVAWLACRLAEIPAEQAELYAGCGEDGRRQGDHWIVEVRTDDARAIGDFLADSRLLGLAPVVFSAVTADVTKELVA